MAFPKHPLSHPAAGFAQPFQPSKDASEQFDDAPSLTKGPSPYNNDEQQSANGKFPHRGKD